MRLRLLAGWLSSVTAVRLPLTSYRLRLVLRVYFFGLIQQIGFEIEFLGGYDGEHDTQAAVPF